MSAYNTLFVSEEKLKSFTSIHDSVSPTDLVPYVLQCQDIYLQSYIGATFYKQLQSQIQSQMVSTNNRFLLDTYIGPMLCNYALYHSIPFLTYKIFNKAILKPNSESAASVDLNEVKFLQSQVKEVAESYVKQMQLHMKAHPGNYPAFIAPNFLDGVLPNNKTPYFGGLQTNSKYFNWKKWHNYPYGKSTTPNGGMGFGSFGDDSDCPTCFGGVNDWPV